MAGSDVDTGNLTEFWLPSAATVANATPTLVEVAEITDVPELPSGTRGTFETTHMKSGAYKTFKKQPRKTGETVTIEGNALLGSTSDANMRAAELHTGPVPYKMVVHEGADTYDVTGTLLVLSYKVTNPMEDGRKFQMQVQWQDEAEMEEAA